MHGTSATLLGVSNMRGAVAEMLRCPLLPMRCDVIELLSWAKRCGGVDLPHPPEMDVIEVHWIRLQGLLSKYKQHQREKQLNGEQFPFLVSPLRHIWWLPAPIRLSVCLQPWIFKARDGANASLVSPSDEFVLWSAQLTVSCTSP